MLRQYSYIGFQEKREETSTSFNFTFYCADDVLPLNNYKFVDYVDRIYPTEFKIKKYHKYSLVNITTRPCLEIDNEGLLRTNLYHKRDCFLLPIVNFSCTCSNMPAVHIEYIYVSICVRLLILPLPMIFQLDAVNVPRV